MFETIKRMLTRTRPEPRPELDPHVAAAALLGETALVDGIYADVESDQISDILAQAFNLSEAEAEKILDQAEQLAETAPDFQRFTKVIKACLPEAERVALVEALWMVALADGEKSPFEDAFIRRISPLMGVDDRARVLARGRAEARVRARLD